MRGRYGGRGCRGSIDEPVAGRMQTGAGAYKRADIGGAYGVVESGVAAWKQGACARGLSGTFSVMQLSLPC